MFKAFARALRFAITKSASLRRVLPGTKGCVKISIVDYGAGNLPSVERALGVLGVETERAADPQQIAAAKILVLPGVGHFSAFVAGLRDRNLTSAIRQAFVSGFRFWNLPGFAGHVRFERRGTQRTRIGVLAGEVRSLPREVKSPHIRLEPGRSGETRQIARRHSRRRTVLFRTFIRGTSGSRAYFGDL